MPSFSTVAYSLLVPAGAVLAGSFIPSAPILRRQSCKTTYNSQNGDTCAKMDEMFGLESGTILATNPFLTCSNVWPNTPICVPDGPHPCSQTYTSKQDDTCESIEKAFGSPEGAILAANTFLTCSNIWVNTPICIPNGGSTPAISTQAKCKSTYYSSSRDTCDAVEKAHNLASGTIKAANSFVTCDDIWPGTPLCIPDGPYTEDIGCTIQTYYSQPKDTCDSIESKFALVSGDVKEDNSYVTCSDIWEGTPLVICVPKQVEQGCTQTINSWECATCDDIGTANGVSGAQIKAWNSFLDCDDIWTNTPVCVKH